MPQDAHALCPLIQASAIWLSSPEHSANTEIVRDVNVPNFTLVLLIPTFLPDVENLHMGDAWLFAVLGVLS